MTITSLHGDALDLLPTLTPGSIQALITSPPYYGLRSYDIPPSYWPEVTYTPMIGLPPVVIPPMVCHLGAEPDPLAYIGHLVHVFRLARPALRTDAVMFVNLGDSYTGSGKGGNPPDSPYAGSIGGHRSNQNRLPEQGKKLVVLGIPDKNLLGIPARAALALQADGWVWRNRNVWHAPNKMPESVRDRFTRAHEDVLFFGNSARYYFDQDEVREPHVTESNIRTKANERHNNAVLSPIGKGEREWNHPAGRNRRDVWSIPTSPMPAHLRGGDEAHYAAWPPALAEIMVKAASANKACGKCGAAWVRQVERESVPRVQARPAQVGIEAHFRGTRLPGQRGNVGMPNGDEMKHRTVTTLGFAPACACEADTTRCVILDCFAGTGTTGAVCTALGRDCILIDLGYQTLQARRTDGIQVEMDAFL